MVVKITGKPPFCRKLLSGRADAQCLTLHLYQKPNNARILTHTVAQPSLTLCCSCTLWYSVCSDFRAKGARFHGRWGQEGCAISWLIAVWIAQFCLLSEFVTIRINSGCLFVVTAHCYLSWNNLPNNTALSSVCFWDRKSEHIKLKKKPKKQKKKHEAIALKLLFLIWIVLQLQNAVVFYNPGLEKQKYQQYFAKRK